MTVDLYEHAERIGVLVEAVPMHGRNGLYDDDQRTIFLRSSLTAVEERSVLAHEVSHAEHRDRGIAQTFEDRADQDAARRLITVDEYAAAEAEVGPDPAALAERLEVCRWVIESWQAAASVGRGWTQVFLN